MKDATSTLPTASAQACGPPCSATRSAAAPRRAGVVPEQGVADRLAGGVEGDHPVLLAGDRDRVGALEQPLGRRVARARSQARGSTSVPGGCGAGLLRDDRAVVGVDEDGFGGLGGGVHAEDERHDSYLVRDLN